MTAETGEQLRMSTLVLRAQLGEERAFVKLWEMYELRLSCFVRWVAGPAAELDDVLQDIWLVVFQKIRGVRSPRAFPAWLYSVARNRAYAARKGGARYKRLLEHLHQTTPQTPDDETDEHALLEDLELVRRCLGKLQPQHCEVLLLRFLEDMPYQQIASVVGCTLGTVRSRIHYAKAALKEAIEREQHAQ